MFKLKLRQIRDYSPDEPGWKRIRKAHPEAKLDDEIDLLSIAKGRHLVDAIYCLRFFPEHDRLWIRYGIWCAAQIEHLMTDKRSVNVLRVAMNYFNGEATDDELLIAADAASTSNGVERIHPNLAAWWLKSISGPFGHAAAWSITYYSKGEEKINQRKKLIQIIEAGKWVD